MAISHKTLRNFLAMFMSEINENGIYAGWIADLEYILWDVLLGKPLESYWQNGITQTDLKMLKELSAEIGGWIAWDDLTNGGDRSHPMWKRRFVRLDEWQQMYVAHKATKEATCAK